MTTYLKDLTQSIGRYGGLSWQKLGLRIFGSTSSYLVQGILASMRGKGKLNMLDDPRQYTLTEM